MAGYVVIFRFTVPLVKALLTQPSYAWVNRPDFYVHSSLEDVTSTRVLKVTTYVKLVAN